jgi:predicted SnoaL-like aldol condensation-catalyzing enzyme
MRATRIGLSLTVTVIAAAAFLTAKAHDQDDKAEAESRKGRVKELLKSIETGDPKPVAAINPKKYIQHNLAVADGLEGLGALLKQLPPNSARVKTVRVFRDGDFVFAHTEYDFFGPKVGFDVFRFENGKIVEHWDNLAEKAKAPNRSGHTQTDGPNEAKDLEKTEANKKLVRAFYEDILMQGKKEKLGDYVGGDTYIQHSPGLGDGAAGFARLAAMVGTSNSPIKFEKIHKVLGEGDFVLVMSEGAFRGKASAFYDLFRVEGGKVAEHWDVIESIPAKADWKNDNGKF